MPKRKYRVTSRANTLGRPRGTVFEAELSEDFERQLLARGALERVKRGEEKKDDDEPKGYKRPEMTK